VQRVSFYFSAHEDDWQLFMNPAAFRDVRDGVKTVFIHVTAGDGGLGTGNGGRKYAYYLAREQGAQSAIRFMADAGEYPPPVEQAAAPVTIEGHAIRRMSYRHTVAYFLRLPDGSPEGTGYAETGHQSLKRLADGHIATLTAIDATTAYHGWGDLVATLHGIVDLERGSASSVDLHVPELDPVLNPNDHPDHVMTGKLALAAAQELSGARLVHHLGYASGARPENLSGYERDMKCAAYAVTLAAIQALDHATSWQHYDQSFVARDYSRADNGSARSRRS
jgi:LmbE family N-acetylglucosaminyl deacetylase